MKKHELVFCIVNQGYSEAVMDAAREAGARGGTILHAKGTANAEAEKMFGIAIQPEKEVVMIVVEEDVKGSVLHALYQNAGLKTAGQGIAFTLPIEEVVGLSPFDAAKKEEAKPAEKAEAKKDDEAKEEKKAEAKPEQKQDGKSENKD